MPRKTTITKIGAKLRLDAQEIDGLRLATNQWLNRLQKDDPTRYGGLLSWMIRNEAKRFLVVKGGDHFPQTRGRRFSWPTDGGVLVHYVAEIMTLQIGHKKDAKKREQHDEGEDVETDCADSGADDDGDDDENWTPADDTTRVRSPRTRAYSTRGNTQPGMPILPSTEIGEGFDDIEEGSVILRKAHDTEGGPSEHQAIVQGKVQKWASSQCNTFVRVHPPAQSSKEGEDLQSANSETIQSFPCTSVDTKMIEPAMSKPSERLSLDDIEQGSGAAYGPDDELILVNSHPVLSDRSHVREAAARPDKQTFSRGYLEEAKWQMETICGLQTPMASDGVIADDTADDRVSIVFGAQRKQVGREDLAGAFQTFVSKFVAQLAELQVKAQRAPTLLERKKCAQGAETLSTALSRNFDDPEVWGNAEV